MIYYKKILGHSDKKRPSFLLTQIKMIIKQLQEHKYNIWIYLRAPWTIKINQTLMSVTFKFLKKFAKIVIKSIKLKKIYLRQTRISMNL
jgi:hypothetical protein